jgi:hypothetical protein
MYTGKHRPGVDPGVGEAAERALTPMLGVIVAGQEAGAVVAGPPEQVGAAVFAMVQGLAALVNLGMLDDVAVDAAVERLILGLRPR